MDALAYLLGPFYAFGAQRSTKSPHDLDFINPNPPLEHPSVIIHKFIETLDYYNFFSIHNFTELLNQHFLETLLISNLGQLGFTFTILISTVYKFLFAYSGASDPADFLGITTQSPLRFYYPDYMGATSHPYDVRLPSPNKNPRVNQSDANKKELADIYCDRVCIHCQYRLPLWARTMDPSDRQYYEDLNATTFGLIWSIETFLPKMRADHAIFNLESLKRAHSITNQLFTPSESTLTEHYDAIIQFYSSQSEQQFKSKDEIQNYYLNLILKTISTTTTAVPNRPKEASTPILHCICSFCADKPEHLLIALGNCAFYNLPTLPVRNRLIKGKRSIQPNSYGAAVYGQTVDLLTELVCDIQFLKLTHGFEDPCG